MWQQGDDPKHCLMQGSKGNKRRNKNTNPRSSPKNWEVFIGSTTFSILGMTVFVLELFWSHPRLLYSELIKLYLFHLMMKNSAANVLKDLTLMKLLSLLLSTVLTCWLVVFPDNHLNYRSEELSLSLSSFWYWGFPFHSVRIFLFILTLLNKFQLEGWGSRDGGILFSHRK